MPSKAERLLTLFQGRTSEFAMGRPETDDRGRVKIVYRPSGKPLAIDDLQAHMDGSGPVVGVYNLREDAHCKFASFDIDQQDLLAAEKLRGIALELGFPDNAMMLVDSGNKGYHLHFFFEAWIPAAQARQLLRVVAARAGMHEKRNAQDKEGIEFFPKQDGFSEHLTYGSLIKLPLVIHPASGRLAGIIHARFIVPAPPDALEGVTGPHKGVEGTSASPIPPNPSGGGSTTTADHAEMPTQNNTISQTLPNSSTTSQVVPNLVVEGGRNSFLASQAGTLRRSGLDWGAIELALLDLNARLCSPPLEAREVRTIARSVSRYPAGEGDLRLHPPTSGSREEGEVEGVERRGRARIIKMGSYDSAGEATGIKWLIDQWLVLGQLHLTVGKEKLGKSTQAWHRVAAVSTGRSYWGRTSLHGRVLVFTEMSPDTVRTLLDEDDIYPNWENVDLLLASDYEAKERMPAFADAVQNQDYIYCLLDPLDECLGLDADAVISSSSTAEGIDLLKRLSSDLGMAVEGLYHFNKMGKVANSYKFTSKPDHIYELTGESPSEITIKYRGRTRAIPKTRKITGSGDEGYEVIDLEGAPIGRPSKTQARVLAWMREAGEAVTPTGVAANLGLSYDAAKKVLSRMLKAGTIFRPEEGLYTYKKGNVPIDDLSTKDRDERGGPSLKDGITSPSQNDQMFGGRDGDATISTTCPTCGSPAFPTEAGGVFCFKCLEPAVGTS